MIALSRTPSRNFTPYQRDFNDLLNRFFGIPADWGPSNGATATGRLVPPIESFLREGELVVRVDVPGIDPNSLDISVEGDRLTVTGERKDMRQDEDGGNRYREVSYGVFERSMSLPWDVDADAV